MKVAAARTAPRPPAPGGASSRFPVRAAATVSVVAVVGLDVVAGAGVTHVGVLAALSVLVSVLRLRLAGRHQLLFALLSAVLVLQPTASLVEQAGPGPHLHAAAEWSSAAAHLLVAVGLAAVVGTAEFHFVRLERYVGQAAWLLAAVQRPRREHAVWVAGPSTHDPASQLWERVGYVPRRGPPGAGAPARPTAGS